MEIHQRRVIRKIIIRGINAKVGIGDSGARHVQGVNDLLEIGGRTVRGDVEGEYDENLDGKRKAKCTAYLTKKNQQIT